MNYTRVCSDIPRDVLAGGTDNELQEGEVNFGGDSN